MKFDEARAGEAKERRVSLDDLPPYKLFIGESSLDRPYKNSRGPWLVVVTNSGKKLINLSNDKSISESLIVGACWRVLPRTNQHLIDPVEVDGAVIRIPQKYLGLLKGGE